jgi:DHA2 family multidrug resistance protein
LDGNTNFGVTALIPVKAQPVANDVFVPTDRSFHTTPLTIARVRSVVNRCAMGDSRGAAVGLLSLLRNEGGSVGTSLAQSMQERRDHFHSLRLGESLDLSSPAAGSFLDQASGPFQQQTSDPVAVQQLALQALENLRQQQASALAYFDVFWVLAVVLVALAFVVLIMKRLLAEKGAGIGLE